MELRLVRPRKKPEQSKAGQGWTRLWGGQKPIEDWVVLSRYREGLGMFPVFLTMSLILVAGSSMYMSVFGLMAVFANHATVILCTGLGMEIGKLLVVSYLYRSWATLCWPSRLLYSLIVFVLVVLTSIEVVGFLSLSHEYSSHDLRIAETDLNSLKNEASAIEKELAIIDNTLAGLPNSHVTRRIEERKKMGYHEKQARMLEITKELGTTETRIIREQQKAGPVFAVAKIMSIKGTDAVFALILLLVLVLEPLSIGLTVAATAVWTVPRADKKRNSESVSFDKEFIELTERHSLSIGQIVQITGRKKHRTCEEWLNGKTPVPPKAFKALKAWVNTEGKKSISGKIAEKPTEKKRVPNGIYA
jgi:hypothetical protein